MDAGVCLFGWSAEMQRVREDAALAAASDANVLLTGERGVGKAPIGDFIHRKRGRTSPSLAVIRCSQPSSTVQLQIPRMFASGSSVLFLDDIGELAPSSQLLLMDVLDRAHEERRPVRVIASASPRLYDLVNEAAFHETLFYRLNAIHITIPSLRHRRADIPGLTNHLLRDAERRSGRPRQRLTRDAMAQLVSSDWPGNLRELDQVITALGGGHPVIRVDDLPASVFGNFTEAGWGARGETGVEATPQPADAAPLAASKSLALS